MRVEQIQVFEAAKIGHRTKVLPVTLNLLIEQVPHDW
jgi:hypothetical protein